MSLRHTKRKWILKDSVAASSAAVRGRFMNQVKDKAASEDLAQLTVLHDMATSACELLKAMANEWRLMILCQLSEGEKTVSELQSLLGLSQSALSQHLAILRREKIVRSRKHAQSVSYSLTGDEATRVMESLHDVFCGAAKSGE
jgi:DNA-binding transcriptional ArsR family regulator